MTSEARHILIAEDEAIISMMVEDFLDQLGHRVAGTCATGAEGEELLQQGVRVDAALLDCNLADGPVWPLARRLKAAGIGFVFASGDGGHGVPDDLRDAPVLSKPYFIEALDQKLAELFAG